MNKDRNKATDNNGLIDGVMICEEEEKKLMHNKSSKSKLASGGMFKFPELSE